MPAGRNAIDALWGKPLAPAASAISINNANQTLEIGASGALTISAAESITNGKIQLDGGTLTDASGVTIGAGALLTGYGTAGAVTLSGGTVTQTGGTLERPVDMAYNELKHYKLPQPADATAASGMMTLTPPGGEHHGAARDLPSAPLRHCRSSARADLSRRFTPPAAARLRRSQATR